MSIKDINARLAALKAPAPSKTGKDAISTFKANAEQQKKNIAKYIEIRDAGQPVDERLNAKSDWFRSTSTGYTVFFGRSRIPVEGGTNYFGVDTLEQVIEVIDDGIELATHDKEFRNRLLELSAASKANTSNSSTTAVEAKVPRKYKKKASA